MEGEAAMGALTGLIEHMDWMSMLLFLMSGAACLICLTVHELAHGLAAYRLGDPTAKLNGRLTLNPLSHIDWIGLFLLMAAGVGWAKPVPVDLRNFRRPRQDMALTALAGPGSNFLLALAALGTGSLVLRFWSGSRAGAYLLLFLCQLAVLSVGLGLFNLIPLSPLDGSKILFALLPDRIYYTILRYEKYVMGVVILLVLVGVFDKPLSFLMVHVLRGFCTLTGMPLGGLLLFQDASAILNLF